jgi:hypothetical protein
MQELMANVLQDAGTHGGCFARCRNSWRVSYKMQELMTGVLQDAGTHGPFILQNPREDFILLLKPLPGFHAFFKTPAMSSCIL